MATFRKIIHIDMDSLKALLYKGFNDIICFCN